MRDYVETLNGKREILKDYIKLSSNQEKRVMKIHRNTCIFDGLAYGFLDKEYIEILKETGINAVHYTVAFQSIHEQQIMQDDFVSACRRLGRWSRILEENKENISLAKGINDLKRINEEGKIAIFFGFQNGSPIEENLDYLDLFYQMGIRFIMLTYNEQNFIGSGGGEHKDSGLSNFGRKVVKRMNKLGICIDLSHCGDQTTRDAIELSDMPCIFTHANMRAIAPTSRNKTDELVKFCVSKGGLIGPKQMIGDTIAKKATEITVEDYVDQIDYIVNLVGIDNVSIGTDFTGTVKYRSELLNQIKMIRGENPNIYKGAPSLPLGFERIDALFNVTRCLIRRNYSDSDIEKIYSGNLKRVLSIIFQEV